MQYRTQFTTSREQNDENSRVSGSFSSGDMPQWRRTGPRSWGALQGRCLACTSGLNCGGSPRRGNGGSFLASPAERSCSRNSGTIHRPKNRVCQDRGRCRIRLDGLPAPWRSCGKGRHGIEKKSRRSRACFRLEVAFRQEFPHRYQYSLYSTPW